MQIMLKLHSNAFAKCDQKGLYVQTLSIYKSTNIRKAPTPQEKNQESLVKIDMSPLKIVI